MTKKLLRIGLTIVVIAVAYAIEIYAAMPVINGPQSLIQLQEWREAIATIRASVPIAATIAIFAVWWEPFKQLWR